jgi:hypothetical protein
MSANLPDYVLTNTWVDLTTLDDYSSMSTTSTTITANYVNGAYVFLGGDSAPDGDEGTLLVTGASLTQTADHWWVRGNGKLGIISNT